MKKSLGIGIDTGGTYTDAVVYDFENQKILCSAKALTTRDDLARGILQALDALDPEAVRSAGVVSLSTTLATNACVEGKGGRAKLLFIGVDKKTVDWVGAEAGLTEPEKIWFLDAGSTIDGRVTAAPDWAAFLRDSEEWFEDADALAIVALNAASNGAILEKEALAAVTGRYGIPVICGHELFSDLNAVKRGASALLNGRLIPVLHEFLTAIRRALEARNLSIPVSIVRSDGSLMSERFSGVRPVETILCGPAASIVGAQALSRAQEAVIVDMGGTTTDIALIRGGAAVRAENGIHIGGWHTFVKGVYVETLGLGGDSAIRAENGALRLESGRHIPLSVLSSRHPGVCDALSELIATRPKHSLPLHEFFVRVRNIQDSPGYTQTEKRFCAALADGPLIYKDAARAIGRDEYGLNFSRLEREGVILRAGLTPTDIMHITGDFSAFDAQAARLGAQFVAECAGIDASSLCEWVYEEVKRKLYLAVSEMLIREELPALHKSGVDGGLAAFLERAWSMARSGREGTRFSVTTDAVLAGVGAPVHIFLPDVARALGTDCLVPDAAGVANALGAVAGSVVAESRATIRPDGERFQVLAASFAAQADDLEAANRMARDMTEREARAEAFRRGATGEASVRFEEKPLVSSTGYGGDVFIESVITATAIGKMSL